MTRPAVTSALAQTEEEFQGAVVALAHLCGWQVMHVRRSTDGAVRRRWTTATSVTGWPDLVLWRPGRLLFRELKTDRGQLTPDQQSVLASLAAAGADAAVWRPRDWPAIETTLRPTQRPTKGPTL